MIDAKISLESFEGPIDLLYHLIEKNKVNIYDIPISLITDQYVQYLDSGEYGDMESMSEFVLMAASLLEIKSKMLLPRIKNNVSEAYESDPREELVARLVEYKRYKDIAEIFKNSEALASKRFYKLPSAFMQNELEPIIFDAGEALGTITLKELYNALAEAMRRCELKTDKVRSSFSAVVRDLFTVEDKIVYIKDLLMLNNVIQFGVIFSECVSKSEIIVTFLALLELCKVNDIQLRQNELFDEIEIQGVNIQCLSSRSPTALNMHTPPQ